MASLSSASDLGMEAPKIAKGSSTPITRATKRTGRRESKPSEERPADGELGVQLLAQVRPSLEADAEDMRDRPLYSPSLSPDDLFAFPFPYVPPLSQETIDRRLRSSRAQIQSDTYQRLFRDLIKPGPSDYEDPDVPCGSCPCCQRMLSYVSSLRTVLDHMVSDIVQKSPAGTRVAPCALCLQEHREHLSHQEGVSPQDEQLITTQQRAHDAPPPLTRQHKGGASSQPTQGRQGNAESGTRRVQTEDTRQGSHRRRSEGRRQPGSYNSNVGTSNDQTPRSLHSHNENTGGRQPLVRTHSAEDGFSGHRRHSGDDSQHDRDFLRTQSQQDVSNYQNTRSPESQNENRSGRTWEDNQDSHREDPRHSPPEDRPSSQERNLESSVPTNQDDKPTNHEVPPKSKPPPLIQPLVKVTGHSGPVPTDEGPRPTEEEDETWRQARSQLLEQPQLSPRDNHSPVIIHGGQYIFQEPDPDRPRNEAYVTMATDNLTALCCLVLGNSLLLSGTTRKLAVVVTDGVSGLLRQHLQTVFDVVQGLGVMDSQGSTKLALLERPELGVSFTKLYVWSLDQFTKCVFLESDTLVVQNCDELFEREELSAVPDIGWPDCFNSGVFVFAPSEDTLWKLIHFAEQQDSFDGGDQGLLNDFFQQNWASDISRKLPFLYNLMANVSYTYKPAFRHFGTRVKIVHFFGSYKPWNVQFNPKTGQMAPGANVHPTYAQFVHFWLEIYTKRVLPIFSKEILDYMNSCEYACPHEVLQFIPSPARRQDSLPTPPSFRVYSNDKPREQPSILESILQLGRDSSDINDNDGYEQNRETGATEDQSTIDDQLETQEAPLEPERDPNLIPGSDIDDYQNMAAWEQGRMDYLGDARSDTILKRLDFLIKGKR